MNQNLLFYNYFYIHLSTNKKKDPILFDDASILAEMVNRLKNESWFKLYSEPTIESLTKYLVIKLEERDMSNHSDVCKYLTEINRYNIVYEFMKN